MHSYSLAVEGLKYEAKVLILVLMENALVQGLRLRERTAKVGLNPCFNGKCTRTWPIERMEVVRNVLILVLMENALVLAKSLTTNIR